MAAVMPETHAGEGRSGTRDIVGSAAGTLGGAIAGGVLLVVNEALAARLLGIEVYGLFALAVALAKISEKISVFGLHLAALHFVPIYRKNGDRARLKGVVAGAMATCGVISMLAASLLWLLAPWFAGSVFEKSGAEPFIRLIAAAIPFMSLTELVGNITRGLGFTRYYVIARNLAPQLLFLVFICVLWLGDAPRVAVAAALALAYMLAFAVGVYGLHRSGSGDFTGERALFEPATLLRYALPIVLNTVLYMVVGWTDLLVLGIYRAADEVGIYRACMQVITIFDMVAVAINAASARAYAVGAHEDDRPRLDEAYVLATRWLSALAVPALALVLVNDSDLLSLMGPGFAQGSTALAILAAGAFVHCYFGAAGFLMVVSGRQSYEALNAGVAGAANIALNLLLVPRYGLPGAAFASALSLLLLNTMRALQVRRLFAVRSLRSEILRTVAVGATVGGVIELAFSALQLADGSGPFSMLLRIVAFAAVYFPLYWRFGLKRAERDAMRKLLRRQVVEAPTAAGRPNFFVVGAPKSGTTAMAQFLAQHPDIYMLHRKEAHFFGSDLRKIPHDFFVLDRERYLALFDQAGNARRVGEASVMYLMSRNAAQEIADFDPQAKVIIMLRNPVDMLPSYHSQLLWGAYEDLPDFEEALAAEPERRAGRRIPRCAMMPDALFYREVVRYAEQVRRYVDALGAENVKVIVYDDFAADTLGTYRDTLRFLGVDPGFVPQIRRINENKVVRSFRVAQFLQDPPPPIAALLKLIPDRLRYWFVGKLQRLNTRYVKRVPIDGKLRACLQQEFATEVAALEALLGRRLDAWHCVSAHRKLTARAR